MAEREEGESSEVRKYYWHNLDCDCIKCGSRGVPFSVQFNSQAQICVNFICSKEDCREQFHIMTDFPDLIRQSLDNDALCEGRDLIEQAQQGGEAAPSNG